MTVYAIGDVQGCRDSLVQLLAKIDLASPDAQLVFVGDVINRGPSSLAALRHVRGLGARARMVLGNHELHLLAVAQGIRAPHRSDTLGEILAAPDREELLAWLRHQPLALDVDGHLVVHAGVLPQWTAQRTMELASEVEQVLRSVDWLDFLQHMYGNTPTRWDETLEGVDRLRCIVNALTRIRFCSADGSMDLISKGDTSDVPGMLRWFDVPGRRSQDVTVVFGHWSTLGLIRRPDIISVDTGCLWGGRLSAVNLSDRSLIQVDCPQYQRPGAS
jgi:bis(5'-nucleosyl)-tetraphosphatase (symmetrical)